MNNIPTVTVIIPALNEEKNIVKVLNSIMSQHQKSYELEKILVISDGSTDNTVKLAKNMNNSCIEVIEHFEREGQLARLNEGYKLLKSDILIQTDADVLFGNSNTLESMVTALLSDEKTMMSCGNALPEKSKGFVQKAIYSTYEAYSNMSINLNEGNNPSTVHGCIIGVKKEFVKNLEVPKEAAVNDMFLYYKCIELGYKYKFVKYAPVYFSLPKNLKDHIKQNIRYYSTSNNVDSYFSKKLIEKEQYVPSMLMLKMLVVGFLKNPLGGIYIFIVNKYCFLKAKALKLEVDPKWEMIGSTKSGLVN